MKISADNCFTVIIIFKCIVCVLTLKCRTNHQAERQKDFYDLASSCMRNGLNFTKSKYDQDDYNGNNDSSKQRNNVYRTTSYYNSAYHQVDNRSKNKQNSPDITGQFVKYKDNKNDQNRHPQRDEYSCVVVNPDYPKYYDERPHQTHEINRVHIVRSVQNRRNTLILTNQSRKNNTHQTMIKSPLQEIDACVIHCIFKEMDMLNSALQPDRMMITNTMTGRIQDARLKEFIQDSIEECFENLDTENEDENCQHSKKLILCLEEKAQANCEDWNESIDTNYDEQRNKMNTDKAVNNHYGIDGNENNKEKTDNQKKNRFNFNRG